MDVGLLGIGVDDVIADNTNGLRPAGLTRGEGYDTGPTSSKPPAHTSTGQPFQVFEK